MNAFDETDLLFIRLIRSQVGKPWSEAKAIVLNQLPEEADPKRLAKFVDERENPGIHINEWGVEPRFYAHRNSKRLLEFYPSK